MAASISTDPPAMVDEKDLPSRILVSVLVCALISWQLFETVSFPRPTGMPRRCLGGTRLQWFLLLLMLGSVVEGIVATVVDAAIFAGVPDDQALSPKDMSIAISAVLAVGRVDQAILSLMIIGLGVSGWSGPAPKHARAAAALGACALLTRSLPAPLVLVGGVSCLQRRSSAVAGGVDGLGDGGDCCGGGFFSLRGLITPAEIERDMQLVRRDPQLHRQFDERVQPMLDAVAPDVSTDEMWALIDTLRPEQVIDAVQQSIGEVVQLGVVVSLGVSGRAHGLRHTWMPIVAALVPGLPVSFATVFYFLLETRHTQGGTLLPLCAPAPTPGKST